MANTDSTYPLWADQVYAINLSLSDPANFSTSVRGYVTPSTINLTNTSGVNNAVNLTASQINFSTQNASLSLSASQFNATSNYGLNVTGALDISAGSVTLNGTPAPTTTGQALIANDAVYGGLKWFTITDLLQLEAGSFSNINFSTGASITFAQPYGTPPAVVITPDCGVNGRIIPVSLAGVTNSGFNAIFGSNKLTSFNFVVLPNNSAYSLVNSQSNFSDSLLNVSSKNIST